MIQEGREGDFLAYNNSLLKIYVNLPILGYFNAATGTERAGYELCVGPHDSDTRSTNCSLWIFQNPEG